MPFCVALGVVMPRSRDERPAVRVYTVCDESRYLIVRNVPALGCGEELLKLLGTYGDIEECKPMDAEECEQFTDVYWIKFRHVSNARFAKRKLDESVFLGNKLQVSYAPHFESLSDTKEKLEIRLKEVHARLNSGKSRGIAVHKSQTNSVSQQMNLSKSGKLEYVQTSSIKMISSDKDYFPSESMNQTVRLVREKLNKIQSSQEHLEAEPAIKKAQGDKRRRI